MSIWVASFGSSLHDPVTTYFLMEVGATTKQVGNFGAIATFGGLIMTPFYGWLLDTKTAYFPCVLSAGCCAFGCLIRGLAPKISGTEQNIVGNNSNGKNGEGGLVLDDTGFIKGNGFINGNGFIPESGLSFLYLSHIILGLGAGNFWTTVGTYVALCMPRDKRALAVSGFSVQVAVMKFLGTSLYPAWDSL